MKSHGSWQSNFPPGHLLVGFFQFCSMNLMHRFAYTRAIIFLDSEDDPKEAFSSTVLLFLLYPSILEENTISSQILHFLPDLDL